MTQKHEDIAVDGVRLEFRWAGPPRDGRPPIVLLHEGLGSVSAWRDFPDTLAAVTGLPVLAYSRRGYGASDPATGPFEPDYMHIEGREVLPGLLAALSIERPILFGHSDGASIALIYAAAHPTAAALVLEAPHVFVEPLTVRSIDAVGPLYEQGELRRRLARHHRDADLTFHAWRNIWLDPRFADWNITDELSRIEAPILMFQGIDDEYGTMAQLDAIRDRTVHTELMMFTDCGHAPHRDRRDAVLDRTGRFLAGLGLTDRLARASTEVGA